MLNYFENDLAVPIILGSSKEAIQSASLIKRKTILPVTVLSEKLSAINKIRFSHKKLVSSRDDILLLTLEDIAEETPEFSNPILVYCFEENGFVSRNRSLLEKLYILISTKELKSYF